MLLDVHPQGSLLQPSTASNWSLHYLSASSSHCSFSFLGIRSANWKGWLLWKYFQNYTSSMFHQRRCRLSLASFFVVEIRYTLLLRITWWQRFRAPLEAEALVAQVQLFFQPLHHPLATGWKVLKVDHCRKDTHKIF